MLSYIAAFAASPAGALINGAVGLIGLAVAIGGFAITIRQIRLVGTIANAQKEAIQGLQIRLSQLDIIAECAKADAALGQLKNAITMSHDSADLMASADRLAISFVTILEGSRRLSSSVEGRVRSAVSEINAIGSNNSSRVAEGRSLAKQLASLREFHGLIVKIRADVQEEQAP